MYSLPITKKTSHSQNFIDPLSKYLIKQIGQDEWESDMHPHIKILEDVHNSFSSNEEYTQRTATKELFEKYIESILR